MCVVMYKSSDLQKGYGDMAARTVEAMLVYAMPAVLGLSTEMQDVPGGPVPTCLLVALLQAKVNKQT